MPLFPAGGLTIVDETMRKCVAYVCADTPDPARAGARRQQPIGTAFLVGIVPAPDEDERPGETPEFPCFVATCKHLVDGATAMGNLRLRFNLADGTRDFEAPRDFWKFHPTADVAILNTDHLPANWWEGIDLSFVAPDQFATDEYISSQQLLGGEVLLPGLFASHPGTSRNQPVLRFGRAAMMNDEEVTVRAEVYGNAYTYTMKAFLIEAQAWKGQSGSPVFISHRMTMPHPTGLPGPITATRSTIKLLGLVSGNYPVRESEFEQNAGIAIVVPSQRIVETLPSGIAFPGVPHW